jgi:hypothetical protein
MLSCLSYAVHVLHLSALNPPVKGGREALAIEGLMDAYVMQGVRHEHVTVR